MPLALALAGLGALWGAMLWLGTGALDHAVLDALYAGGNEAQTTFALIITRFGDPDLLLLVTGLLALLLIARRDVRAAALLLGISLSGRAIVDLQKAWIARPRPDAHLHLIGTRTDSFPSGHAASAVLVWLTLALLIPRDARWRRTAIAAALLACFLSGLSRPMLGVHYPSDVIAGWSFGLLWLLLLSHLTSRPGNAVRAGSFSPSKERDDGQDPS
jgi:membrane-associated phospholipid phosphatase